MQRFYSCPDCGGTMWEVKSDDQHQYQCGNGHIHSKKTVIIKQVEVMECSLFKSLCLMEERKEFFGKMDIADFKKGNEFQGFIDKLKEILLETTKLRLGLLSSADQEITPDVSSGTINIKRG